MTASMVHLDRIYTRSGDDGTTGLGDGSRLPKHHLRIAAYGTLDELSSALGVALAHGVEGTLLGKLRRVQNDLFDAGADLSVPGEGDEGGKKLRVQPVYTKRLEEWIDELNGELEPLSSFVLPGGTPAAAQLHVARTVCRRAERLVCELAARDEERERVNSDVVRYLNRLSDLLFVMARWSNERGKADVLWKPGDTQTGGGR